MFDRFVRAKGDSEKRARRTVRRCRAVAVVGPGLTLVPAHLATQRRKALRHRGTLAIQIEEFAHRVVALDPKQPRPSRLTVAIDKRPKSFLESPPSARVREIVSPASKRPGLIIGSERLARPRRGEHARE
jgi:hypothetical protein